MIETDIFQHVGFIRVPCIDQFTQRPDERFTEIFCQLCKHYNSSSPCVVHHTFIIPLNVATYHV